MCVLMAKVGPGGIGLRMCPGVGERHSARSGARRRWQAPSAWLAPLLVPSLASLPASGHSKARPTASLPHPVQNAKGAIVVGILFVTFISWIPSHGNAAR